MLRPNSTCTYTRDMQRDETKHSAHQQQIHSDAIMCCCGPERQIIEEQAHEHTDPHCLNPTPSVFSTPADGVPDCAAGGTAGCALAV